MDITNNNTETAILNELCRRLVQIRLERNLTQDELARTAGVSKRTIERLESGRSVQLSNLIRTLRALNLAQNFGQLLPATGPSPLQQLKLRSKERRRASGNKKPATGRTNWTWSDDK
jgi:transcriptional regulator with XRE-family HTH domain